MIDHGLRMRSPNNAETQQVPQSGWMRPDLIGKCRGEAMPRPPSPT